MIRPFHNINLKLIAFFSAIIVWFIVITVENTIYPFPEALKVEASELGPNLSIATELPEVKLYLRVAKEELKTLTANDFEVFIDLQEAQTGEQRLPVIATTTNPETRILKVDPSEVTLKISPTAEREVEVRVNVEGEPSEGYIVEETRSESELVKISGAQSVIDRIDYVEAQLILDGTETSDIKQSVKVILDEELSIPEGLVTLEPEQLAVSAVISSELKQKEVEVSIAFSHPEERNEWIDRIAVSPETVLVRAQDETLEVVSSVRTRPLDLTTLNRTGSVELSLELPEGVQLVHPGTTITVTLVEEIEEEGTLVEEENAAPEEPNEPTI